MYSTKLFTYYGRYRLLQQNLLTPEAAPPYLRRELSNNLILARYASKTSYTCVFVFVYVCVYVKNTG